MVRGRCGYGECVYRWYTWFSCLSSTGDVLKMSVVRGVGGVCDMCMCFTRGGLGGVGSEWVGGFGQGLGGGDCGVCCESGLFVLITGPGICIL